MNYKLIKELKTKSGQVFPPGFSFNITVLEKNPTIAILEKDDFKLSIKSHRLHVYFEGFDYINMDIIESAMMDRECLSLTGDSVEPDGWDEKGFPSMLMACGLC